RRSDRGRRRRCQAQGGSAGRRKDEIGCRRIADPARLRALISMAVTGPEIERLIALMSKLPGLGPRSARRAVLQLIKKKETLLSPLADAMAEAAAKARICSVCGNVDTQDPCAICADNTRDPHALCIVEEVG